MAEAKNPVMAAILNIIPGLGTYVICKNSGKGIKLFLIAIALWVLTIISFGLLGIVNLVYWVLQIYDGYMEAQGKPVIKI
jgi:hypothetical protein